MDVTIYYSATNDGVPGGVERLSTPLESGYDHWRVGFIQDEERPGTWCLMLTHWCNPTEGGKRKGWGWHKGYALLGKKCGSIADYLEWLTENIQIIEVDGRPFWVNPKLGEEE